MDETEVFEKMSKPYATHILSLHDADNQEQFVADFHHALWEGCMEGNEGNSFDVIGEDYNKVRVYNENSFYDIEEHDVIPNHKYKLLIGNYIILLA